MNDEELRSQLQSLPRLNASTDFTRKVLQRIREDGAATQAMSHRPNGSRRDMSGQTVRYGWRAAAALLLVLLGAAAGYRMHQSETERSRLAQLQWERQQIATELDELKKLTQRNEPVMVLGATDQIDLVLDLRNAPPSANSTIKEASF